MASRQHTPQQPTVAAQVAQRRIPTVLMIVDLCQANATFPIKTDFRMTAEVLREAAFQHFQLFCRDNGVPFTPPSLRPVDYTLLPCFEDGQIDSSMPPLRLASHGGATIREQMQHLPTPCYISMVIGTQWLERDSLFREEDDARGAIVQKRDETIASMGYFADVSKERAMDQQQQRERHETVVAKVEDVLCYLFVSWSKHERKINHEDVLLQKGRKLWEQQVARYEADVTRYQQQKRMFFQASSTSVVTGTVAMLKARVNTSDEKREQLLKLLEGFSN